MKVKFAWPHGRKAAFNKFVHYFLVILLSIFFVGCLDSEEIAKEPSDGIRAAAEVESLVRYIQGSAGSSGQDLIGNRSN